MKQDKQTNQANQPNQRDLKKLLWEFLRYIVVGGVAFWTDVGSMTLCKELFFRENCTSLQMALCVAVGFVIGLLVNYLLSTLFVFRTADQKRRSRGFAAFAIYAAVGLVGFALTELLMWLGVKLVGSDGLWYVLIKCGVSGVVLIWNYVGRKIFVYHGE